MKELAANKEIMVRFSEVGPTGVVKSVAYAHYFEDAREEFGRKYGLEYMRMAKNSFAAPLVELTFKAIRPMYYERPYSVAIRYIPTEAAKILFRYEITDLQSGEVVVTGKTLQVFMDMEYRLLWYKPYYYIAWQKRWEVME